jgi:hypothetical protein
MIGPQEQVPGDAEKLGAISKANLAQIALGLIPDRRLLLVRKVIIEAPLSSRECIQLVKHIHRSCLCCMTAFGHSTFGIANILDKRPSEADAKLKRVYDAIEDVPGRQQ